nr:hypothetical protein CFP56_07632 [Quercus suber]
MLSATRSDRSDQAVTPYRAGLGPSLCHDHRLYLGSEFMSGRSKESNRVLALNQNAVKAVVVCSVPTGQAILQHVQVNRIKTSSTSHLACHQSCQTIPEG